MRRRVPWQWYVTAFWIAVTICAVAWPTPTVWAFAVFVAVVVLAKGLRLLRAERRGRLRRSRG